MYYMVPHKTPMLSHLQLRPVTEPRMEILAATNSIVVGIVRKGNQKIRRLAAPPTNDY
jgi:hypothetical protein